MKRGIFSSLIKSYSTASKIDVAGWIQKYYTPYEGDSSFLSPPTEKTQKIWKKCEQLIEEELKNGVLDIDTKTISTITSHKPGYITQEDDVIVGIQTDEPLKRQIKPFGGINIVKNACEAYGYTLDPKVEEIFHNYRKTHNEGVFDLYTNEMRVARTNSIVTGLPDGYGRGRIIGDYRRIALYGIDELIKIKEQDKTEISESGPMNEFRMRLIGEIADQIKALKQIKELGKMYGFDIGRPALNAKEAVQWTYFGYLSAIKEQDGAAMSLGRVDAFLDVFIEKDLKEGIITEKEAQELIDQFVIKLRLARHLRTPEYNDLFAGDPTWVTAVLGGVGSNGKHLVTKTAYRMLHTLYNLSPAPEPNMTVLWDENLPQNFKNFCSKVSIDTSSIQYENDSLMRSVYGSDYGIACCVSAMRIGKDMQFFGARCNLAKLLLYSFNGGVDEVTHVQISPNFGVPKIDENTPLDYEEVKNVYYKYMDWIAKLYVNTMNIIHYSHDKYCYEAAQMALHDTDIHRYMAFGVAGLSVVADSLSAMKFAKVYPIIDKKTGLVVDFKIEGDFPKFGNDDEKVDQLASEVVEKFTEKLKNNPTYRDSEHTLSVLTITSNVVYGNKTGSTPDGRKIGQPFAPGCNPMHGRDCCGAVASLNSVAKVPYSCCKDGISNTFSIIPNALGKKMTDKVSNLSGMLDGYFKKGGFHLNVNVLQREVLLDAMKHPELYPSLTVRVSGYAVRFNRLTQDQQLEVIARTFHETF